MNICENIIFQRSNILTNIDNGNNEIDQRRNNDNNEDKNVRRFAVWNITKNKFLSKRTNFLSYNPLAQIFLILE